MRIATAAPVTAPLRLVPAAIVLGSVLFNAVLAIVNGHVTSLGSAPVIACEVALVAAAHAVALTHYRREMLPWYLLMGVFAFIAVYRSLALAEPDVKYLRDVMIIPTFVVLGMTFDVSRLNRIVLTIHAIILAVMLFEAIDTSAYSELFRIQDYYISTRGYDVTSFWNSDSDLYVSATRPDERMFSFIDLHRLSSAFLEPVSLGNYCIIITAYLSARFRRMSRGALWFMIGGNLLMIIGCDGRLAAASSVIIIAATMIAPRLPRHSFILYAPGIVLCAFVLVHMLGLQAGPDNFSGRIAHTVRLLEDYGVPEFLGVSNQYMSRAVDSGLGYLITTQSIVGSVVLYLVFALASADQTREQRRFNHAACLYLGLSLIVSFAFLTIKTAALLWFVHGTLQRRRSREGVGAKQAARLAIRGSATLIPPGLQAPPVMR
jgi:putative polymerase